MKNKTMDVLVHKQALSLGAGESIDMFTQKLYKASREHIMGKLNINKGSGGSWLVEAFGDKVVMAAYKSDDSKSYSSESNVKYYAFKYSRNKEGTFEFGDSYEVERITSYKPKSNNISKSGAAKEMIDDEEDEKMKACGGKTRKALGDPLEFGGWRETNKSFWQGVI